MINTKQTTLEYWLGARLKKNGEASPNTKLRNRLDAWFIDKGFSPTHRAYSQYFSEYYNDKDRQVISVCKIWTFDDSLLGTNSWVVATSRNKTGYYLAPYNSLYDFGVMWGKRDKVFTDEDNSNPSQLEDTLELLIENGIAYEL